MFLRAENRFITDSDRDALARVDVMQDEVIGKAFRDTQPRSKGMRVQPKIAKGGTLLECPHDWRTAIRLHGNHTRSFCILQPTECFQLIKSFPHADQPRAPTRWINNHI